jgi:NAD(P)-dependent dehydrogenase (short-subunit alcohol dehydrogenase family)
MNADPSSSVAVVTGGTQGIGLAVAEELASQGHRLAVLGRTPSTGQEAAARLGDPHIYVACDVADESQIKRAFGEVVDRLGPVDILVNKAKDFADSDKGEQATDAGLDKAGDAANSATGGKFDDKIDSATAAADKKIGD